MLQNKILPPALALKKITLLRQSVRKKTAPQKIVFTNGCFDILHAGHVTYLEKAKKMGDILVVALNGDASVKKLKGLNRPINPLFDRAKVIAALESVSIVTWFHEETPLKLISKILPDLLVKGGDYEVKKIVGYAEVTKNGGKVKTIPFLKGRSTSKIISRGQK